MGYLVYFEKQGSYLQLPVNPEAIEASEENGVVIKNILGKGNITLPTGKGSERYRFGFELPDSPKSYGVDTGRSGREILETLKRWRKSNEPFWFAALGNGQNFGKQVLMETLSYREQAGEENDFYVELQLVEYQAAAKGVDVLPPTGGGGGGESSSGGTRIYVVKAGDCLWTIAKRYLGKGTRYVEIYELNKNIIKNPALIYPGQVLTLPAA